jgi:hypothetical protein
MPTELPLCNNCVKKINRYKIIIYPVQLCLSIAFPSLEDGKLAILIKIKVQFPAWVVSFIKEANYCPYVVLSKILSADAATNPL